MAIRFGSYLISEDISKCQAGYSESVEAKKKKVAFVCYIYYFLVY